MKNTLIILRWLKLVLVLLIAGLFVVYSYEQTTIEIILITVLCYGLVEFALAFIYEKVLLDFKNGKLSDSIRNWDFKKIYSKEGCYEIYNNKKVETKQKRSVVGVLLAFSFVSSELLMRVEEQPYQEIGFWLLGVTAVLFIAKVCLLFKRDSVGSKKKAGSSIKIIAEILDILSVLQLFATFVMSLYEMPRWIIVHVFCSVIILLVLSGILHIIYRIRMREVASTFLSKRYVHGVCDFKVKEVLNISGIHYDERPCKSGLKFKLYVNKKDVEETKKLFEKLEDKSEE